MLTTRSVTVAAISIVLLVAAAAAAQDNSLNRVGDAGFESGNVSLSLPSGEPFPWFSGGWASRGGRVPQVSAAGGRHGKHALRLASRAGDPTHVIQDVPIAGAGFDLRFSFMIESGTQSARLLIDWDRRDPSTGVVAFEATISTDVLLIGTPTGSWRLPLALAASRWHELRVTADPRRGTQTIVLNGRQMLSLPGVARRSPRTLVLGGSADGAAGVFRYDSVTLMALVDVELASLRRDAALLHAPLRTTLANRLDAAATALGRGAPTLALPELAVARNLLRRAARSVDGDGAQPAPRSPRPRSVEMLAAVQALIDLVEAGMPAAPARRRFQP